MIERQRAMNTPDVDLSPIERLVHATRRLLRGSWVATGMGLTVGLAVGVLVAAALLDLAAPLWPALRFVALLAVVLPAGWVFVVGVLRPLFRRLRPVTVARKIESHLPGIHNRLVSCIDFSLPQKRATVSPAFFQRLVTEALARIRGFRPRAVVDVLSLRRSAAFAGVSLAALLIAWALFSDRLPTALARIFAPLADIPPASGVEYHMVSPGQVAETVVRPAESAILPSVSREAKVLRGEDIDFAVQVTRGEPESLLLELEADDGGERLNYALSRHEDGLWRFPLSGWEKSFRYRVRGGGTWTRLHHVTIVDRPRIADLATRLFYPEYMGIGQARTGAPQSADVAGPVGSSVEVTVRVEGDPVEGEIQLLQPRTVMVDVADRPERVWFAEKLPDGVAPVGTWEWVAGPEGRRAHTEPAAGGEHQHFFSGDAAGLLVASSESLFAYVYVVPGAVPETIMLQWNDGGGWEHRAYWGADKVPHGEADAASRRNLGPLPAAGVWTRLEVPADLLDLEGQTVRGMGFTLFGGQCYWGSAGTLGPRHAQREELTVVASYPLAKWDEAEEAATAAGGGLSPAVESSAASSGPPVNVSHWNGRFPVEENGFYRVELRNELGYANQQMKEGRITAIPDEPPQVALERPGEDITLSEPKKIALVIAAFDDFGLADVVLSVQRGDSGGFMGETLKTYRGEPVRSESVLAALDVPSYGLTAGEYLRYRVEVRDRKGQAAATRDYVVRIAQDDSAADRRLAQLAETQDTFQEKLAQLISEQAKINEQVETLEAKYEPLAEKIEAAEEQREAAAEAAPQPAADTQPPPPPEPPKPLELDAESQQLLQELRIELAQLAQQEAQNAQLGQQVAADAEQMAEQAAEQQLLPEQIVEQMRQLEEAFRESASDPLQALAAQMQQAAQPDPAEAPDVEQIDEDSRQVQENLEALQARMEAIAEATEQVTEDPQEAIAQLEREMLRQDAGLTAEDLAQLREFLAEQLAALRDLSGEQEELVDTAENARLPESLLDDLAEEQTGLEERAETELAETRELQAAARPERMRRPPEFPDAPYDPEQDEFLVPPEEEDPAGAEGNEEMAADEQAEGQEDDSEDVAEDAAEEEEELYLPALGGPKPKIDPRFAEKLRPLPPEENDAGDEESAGSPEPADEGANDDRQVAEDEAAEDDQGEQEGEEESSDDAQAQREELARRGWETLSELDLAGQSVEADQTALEELLARLEEALQIPASPEASDNEAGEEESGEEDAGEPAGSEPPSDPSPPGERPLPSGQGQGQGNEPAGDEPPPGEMPEGAELEPISPELAAQLAELMNLPEMRQALEMAARLRQMRSGQQAQSQSQQPGAPQGNPPPSPTGNLTGTTSPNPAIDAALADLDLETRTIILKMQPRVREELLQGMREQGPEGYRKFIQDYFKRLTKVKENL